MEALEKSGERKTPEEPMLNRSAYCSPEAIWLTASNSYIDTSTPRLGELVVRKHGSRAAGRRS